MCLATARELHSFSNNDTISFCISRDNRYQQGHLITLIQLKGGEDTRELFFTSGTHYDLKFTENSWVVIQNIEHKQAVVKLLHGTSYSGH